MLRRARRDDQVGLGARDRARNLAGQLWVPDGRVRAVAGRAVVLVDDVLTTGATFAAVAQRAGAGRAASSSRA